MLELTVFFLLSDTCLKTGHSHVPCGSSRSAMRSPSSQVKLCRYLGIGNTCCPVYTCWVCLVPEGSCNRGWALLLQELLQEGCSPSSPANCVGGGRFALNFFYAQFPSVAAQWQESHSDSPLWCRKQLHSVFMRLVLVYALSFKLFP